MLGALAKAGYATPPDEARDLLHDFYVEAWEGVVQRHDASRSTFTTYMSGAFFQFARRRIVQARAWRYRLVDLDEASEVAADQPTPAEALEAGQGIEQVKQAVERLPPAQRELLHAYVDEPAASERVLAHRYSLSRHAVRAGLAEAVAKVAEELGQSPASGAEGEVIDQVWNQGRSTPGTAAALRVAPAEVRRVRAKYGARLLACIRGFDAARPGGRDMTNRFVTMMRDALLAPGDKERLACVAENAAGIRDALQRHDGVISDVEFERVIERDADWIGEVYSALGACEAADEASAVAALRALRDSETQEIGLAFASLLIGLGPQFHNWDRLWTTVPVVSPEVQDYLSQDGTAPTGGPHAAALLKYGITPLTVHSATRQLELLFDRARRALTLPRPGRPIERWLAEPEDGIDAVRLQLVPDETRSVAVPMPIIDDQLAGSSHLQPAALAPFRDWLFNVLGERPHLVHGYRFDVTQRLFVPDSAVIARSDEGDDLVNRWTRPARDPLRELPFAAAGAIAGRHDSAA